MMFKTNVVKKNYALIAVNEADGAEQEFRIIAESEEAAKLLIPEGFLFRKWVSNPND